MSMCSWNPNFYYIDKSLFIKVLLKQRQKVILITAPQSFLKTSNLSMAASFLSLSRDSKSKETKKELFQNRKIMSYPNLVNRHFDQYPLIYISFNQNESYDRRKIGCLIRNIFKQNDCLLQSSKLTIDEKGAFYSYLTESSSEIKMSNALSILCELLYKHYGQRVYVFIDNYDAPILEAICSCRLIYNLQPMFERMLSIVSNNACVQAMVLTGTTGIVRFRNEDVAVCRFLHNHPFSQYFCFTEEDVEQIAIKCSTDVLDDMKKRSYYTVTNKNIYSPEWILNYLNYSRIEEVFWYECIFTRPIFLNVPVLRNQIQNLFDGKNVKFVIHEYQPEKDVWLLNRLLNGTVDCGLDDSELDFLLSMLLDFGMLNFIKTERKIQFACLGSKLKSKFSLSAASRGSQRLKSLMQN